MTTILANYLADILEKKQIIKKEKEIYIVGLGIMINYAISCISIFTISLFTSSILEGITFIFFFGYFREYVGGYHSHTYLGCFIKFVVLYVFSLLLLKVNMGFFITSLIISIIILSKIVPVEHPNNPFSEEDSISYRKIAQSRLIVMLIISIFFAHFMPNITKMILLTIILSTGLAVLQIYINKGECQYEK